jgi:hypothetical protein
MVGWVAAIAPLETENYKLREWQVCDRSCSDLAMSLYRFTPDYFAESCGLLQVNCIDSKLF